MVQSLGLTLYNLRVRKDPAVPGVWPARPEGRLVWLHAPSARALRALQALALRVVAEADIKILVTCPETVPFRGASLFQLPPDDTLQDVRAFLNHWQPEIAVFTEGELRPALLHAASDRGIPVLMVNGGTPFVLRTREGWYPGLTRSALQTFQAIFCVDEPAARAFRKAGALLSRVQVTGRMEEESAALPCLEAERAALAKLLATRPVWLAAGLPEAEEGIVIAAHRAVQSQSHRLLLIVAPEDPARAAPLAARLADDDGLVVAQRAAEQEPEADVEVYVADGMAELGLWYRLAPITFLGGSLAGQGCIRNPMEPAALGSAILYGARPGEFGATFGRLGAARAARAVSDTGDLAGALSDLLSPERAARLAQAAWSVASDGTEVTDRVLDIIRHAGAGKR